MRIKRLIAAVAAFTMLAGCGAASKTDAPPPDERIQIIATLFPQYDFARQVAGEHANVTLLLPPGVESHSYEPSPADIVKINNADLFIFTGAGMEPWASKLLEGVEGEVTAVDASANVPLDAEEHPAHEGHVDGDEDDDAHGVYDPHIWTNPQNAAIMVENITEALCAADPQNAADYQRNAADYQTKLEVLDAQLMEIAESGTRREIVFGGRFALRYFAERYGLEYLAAFDSCSSETEPSAKAVAAIIDEIRARNIPVIYHEEMTDPKVARSIAQETGVKLLLLHSCHNVSKDEMANGATYLSLMEQNAQNLREGLH